MINFIRSFNRRLFCVVLGAMFFVVCSTGEAPKEPISNQVNSEIGRYAFWSISRTDFGILDTKRGRVWIFAPDTGRIWSYHDLNYEAAIQVPKSGLVEYFEGFKELAKKQGNDSLVAHFEKMIKETTNDEIKRIKEMEK